MRFTNAGAVGILALSVLNCGCATSAMRHATPARLIASADPCAASQEKIDWLRSDIYPRLARDIPRILAQGWADAVSNEDLHHAHIYLPGAPAQPTIAQLRRSKDRIGVLYHSREEMPQWRLRNIFAGPGARFEALDDMTIPAIPVGAIDEETGAPLQPRPASHQAYAVPAIGIEQVNFGVSERELERTFSGSEDYTSVARVGAYWFGIYRTTGGACMNVPKMRR